MAVKITWRIDVDNKAVSDTLTVTDANPLHSETKEWRVCMDLLRVILSENLEFLTGEKGPNRLKLEAALAEANG